MLFTTSVVAGSSAAHVIGLFLRAHLPNHRDHIARLNGLRPARVLELVVSPTTHHGLRPRGEGVPHAPRQGDL